MPSLWDVLGQRSIDNNVVVCLSSRLRWSQLRDSLCPTDGNNGDNGANNVNDSDNNNVNNTFNFDNNEIVNVVINHVHIYVHGANVDGIVDRSVLHVHVSVHWCLFDTNLFHHFRLVNNSHWLRCDIELELHF